VTELRRDKSRAATSVQTPTVTVSAAAPPFVPQGRVETPTPGAPAPGLNVARADIHETGEPHPRLPEAGRVRDQATKRLAFEAPFALTGQVARSRSLKFRGWCERGDSTLKAERGARRPMAVARLEHRNERSE
jgi:hypothetical protein